MGDNSKYADYDPWMTENQASLLKMSGVMGGEIEKSSWPWSTHGNIMKISTPCFQGNPGLMTEICHLKNEIGIFFLLEG